MLEKPYIQDEKIIACLEDKFGLAGVQVDFLPLGADLNTAVYRGVDGDENAYFIKLRSGAMNDITVALPKYLCDQGNTHIIPPQPDRNGQLWASLDDYKLILYPFVEGKDGYKVSLSDRQWGDLGAALKKIHTTALPIELLKLLRQETYSPRWRESLKRSMDSIEHDSYTDPVACKTADFMKSRRNIALDLIEQAERLAAKVQARSPQPVLCHSDIHAGNVLITKSGALYIVDWDDPIYAPKERDLMYIGGGLMGGWRTPRDEEILFYQGYGPTQIDRDTLAYYRFERIIEDLAIYCEQLLMSSAGGDDREQSLQYLMSNFWPGHTIEIAYQASGGQNVEL